MKNIVIICTIALVSILIMSCNNKRDGFIIHGTVGDDLKLDSIMINRESIEDEGAIYAVPVVNGKFTIEGKVDAIERVSIGNVKADIGNYFVLENDEYTIDIDSKLFHIKGGKTNERVFGFYNTKEYMAQMDAYNSAAAQMDAIDEEDEEEAMDEMYQLNAQVDEVMYQAGKIEDNHYKAVFEDPKSSTLEKMFVLTNSQNFGMFPPEERRRLLTEYKKELGNHRNIEMFISFLDQEDEREKMKGTVSNGATFKPVVGVDINGKQIQLGDVVKKNKYTLLEFWASWCGPCRAEVPHLKDAYAKFKDKGLEIYSFSTDDNASAWKKAIKDDQPNWNTHVLKQGKAGEKILNSYGIDGIPASYLIDQNGKIVANNEELRGIALKETLSKLLK